MGSVTATFIVGAVFLLALVLLFRRDLRTSENWRATVTPLASIIGSGFLVVAPLLSHIVGSWAPLAMAAIVVVAYLVGGVIRYNIVHVEPLLENSSAPERIRDLDRLSDLALGFAYVVSVAFYLQLLAAFVFKPFGLDPSSYGRALATGLVVLIGMVGWMRGLGGLEFMEEVAVGVKLSIIAGMLAGMLAFDLGDMAKNFSALAEESAAIDLWTATRTLAGMLLVVQGFETSRYLGHAHDRSTRVRTMRAAQLISGAIYVLFVLLIVPLASHFPSDVSETAVLEAARAVTPILVPLIIIAAVASQFSAAVADSAGGGGLLAAAGVDVAPRGGYVAIAVGALAVIWSTDVFGIIAFASRAFGVYYLIQVVTALVVVSEAESGPARRRHSLGFSAIGLVLVFVVLAGIPAG